MRLLSSLALLVGLVGGIGFFGPALVAGIGARVSPGVVFTAPGAERLIGLTIDDGPSSATREILDVLDEHGARATFFVIGEHVLADPGAVREIVERGSEIGHHMMTDEPSILLEAEAFGAEFDRMHALLSALPRPGLFRPGSGWYDLGMVEAVERRGYRLVLGSVYPFDAQIASVRFASWYILRRARAGDIIVLHDGAARGLRTAQVLRQVLPELKRRGYRVTGASELIDRSQMNGGPWVGRGSTVRSEHSAGM